MAKKITIEFNKTTVIFGLILLALGYFIGNTLPIFGGYQVGSGQTTITTSPAEEESLQPSTAVSLSVDGDPTIGDANAPVQFYEFSDFQCPFCRRFFTESLSQLEQEYISTGDVLFVYKDFPLDQIHPAARPAALYSECANEQGKWREMHDYIFNEQNKLGLGTIDFGTAELDQWAQSVGLDTQSLNSCIESGKYASEVEDDLQTGIRNGVSGTPTFFIGNEEKGFVRIVGAQPYSVLKQVVDQYLQ